MEKTWEFKAGEGRFAVRMVVHTTDGHGICCVVTGGEFPHIGGVASCFRGENSESVVREISFPTHKDAVLARQLAEILFKATGQDIVVTAGIHIDHASPADIQILCDNALTSVQAYIRAYEETNWASLSI